MKTFKNMITNNIVILELDTRSGDEKTIMFNEMNELGEGQHSFEDNIFIVTGIEGNSGMGGMDMGNPDTVRIQRIV